MAKDPALEKIRQRFVDRGFTPTQVRWRDKIRYGNGRHTNLIDVHFEIGKGPRGLDCVTVQG